MSSWSGQHPPPPSRGERSRSPRSAHGRGSYPDPAYPYDQYRGDWDNYSRERPWSDVERDRATYDYSRRGRSRSPPPDDRQSLPKFLLHKHLRVSNPWQVESDADLPPHMIGNALILVRGTMTTMVCPTRFPFPLLYFANNSNNCRRALTKSRTCVPASSGL